MKKGVLVMAYGSPDKTEDIEAYYTDIRRGRQPSPEQLAELTGRYDAIGGSPLLKITTAQAENLQNELGSDYHVFMGMRHWKPWILEAVDAMKNSEITDAVGLVMAPHYSSLSIEKYIEKVNEALGKLNYNINMQYIRSWHNHPLYIEALHNKAVKALELFNEDELRDIHLVFTAHSLPEKILEINDPYKDELMETCRLISQKEHIERWSFAFQSAGRTQEKWLGPDLLDEINRLKETGVKSVLVCSIGFVTDHLEVLYDIDIEAKKHAKNIGIHLERTDSLNADPLVARLLSDMIKETMK